MDRRQLRVQYQRGVGECNEVISGATQQPRLPLYVLSYTYMRLYPHIFMSLDNLSYYFFVSYFKITFITTLILNLSLNLKSQAYDLSTSIFIEIKQLHYRMEAYPVKEGCHYEIRNAFHSSTIQFLITCGCWVLKDYFVSNRY